MNTLHRRPKPKIFPSTTLRKNHPCRDTHTFAPPYTGCDLPLRTPITGEVIAQPPPINAADATKAIAQAHAAFLEWRTVPAPKRGELIRLLGEELRAELPTLGRLVTIETGKILSEGHGEVQEM